MVKNATESELRSPDSLGHTDAHKDDLAGMLSRIDQTNRHPECDTGPAQGKEEW